MTRGLIARVHGYDVLTAGDDVRASNGLTDCTHHVDGLERFLAERPEHVRVGYGRLPDFDVLYLYDCRDGFGYALNVDAVELSEWGYAPFTPARESDAP